MHAILGLAASELIRANHSLVEAAINHRLQALRGIKRRLGSIAPSSAQAPLYPPCPSASPPSTPSCQKLTYEEGNALLATCFALTFQSVILEDGMVRLSEENPSHSGRHSPTELGVSADGDTSRQLRIFCPLQP